ncbi:MAG: alkaline phosphatase D family protein, partial [Pseudomonadota bacterium]
VVLHLGDYIYEYAAGKYSAPDVEAAGRTADPANEIVSVSDYRQRYALYRTDPDLQAVHAVHPFITIWDDHEFSNDTWSGGAENHQPEQEGLFTQRRENALKVYAEWMPTRADMRRPWRSFDFGNLARIIMLDTRIWGRDKQLDYAADFQPRTIPFDVTDPKNPKPLATPNARASYAAEDIKRLPVPFDFRQDPPKPVMDYTTLSTFDPKTAPQYLAYLPDVGAFKEQLESPGRSLLGEEQEAWLGPQLQGSKKRGQPWQIIGQQVVMGNIVIPPDLADVVEGQTGEVADAIRSVARLAPYKLPTNLDAWDGYPAARARLYAQLRQYARNGIVISGDSHNAWLNELADDKGKVGYEFAVPSVSSPGYEGYIGTSAKQLESSLAAASPGLQWMDARHRGYVTLHVTQDQVEATYHRISTAKSRDYEQLPKKRFTVRAGESPADAALSDLG